MKVRYLSYNEILDLYREQMSIFGGLCAIRDNNALLSIVANPRREFAGQELYPDIAAKIAIIVFSIIKNHPFADGNKRTAYIAGRLFLRINNFDLDCEHSQFKNLVLNIAASKATLEDVREWFNVNLCRKGEKRIKAKKENK